MNTRPVPALPDVQLLRRHFPALHQNVNGYPLIYLDSAATAQKPREVIDAVSSFYENDNANVHRGLYELARRATEDYESARRTVARFLNALPEEIVFVRGATEAINLVAATWGATLKRGDEIVLSVMEHHSNIVPWQLAARRSGAVLRYIDIDEQGRLQLDHLDRLLNERTRIVAVGHVSNALGTINPIKEIARRAHHAGALMLVDGAQGAPHLHPDVHDLDCDFYALSSHKMGGPMGVGALWGRAELLDAMPPYQGGGEMISRVELEYSTYAELPHKFEAGTPDVAGAVGLAAGIDFLERVGFDVVSAMEDVLVRHALERLPHVKGLRILGTTVPEERTAAFSFTIDGVHPHDVATILDSRGIAVRAGHHCAQPLMRCLGVPATTRASCFLYNTTSEIDALADALDAAREMFA